MYAAVGAGKTFTMIAACMELRRMGLATRCVISCLNSTVEQFTHEARRLYPAAKILAYSENQMEKASPKVQRRRFLSRIATGDWDIIILSHTQFFSLKISSDTERKFLREELRQVTTELKDIERDSPSVKDLERLKRNLETRIKDTTRATRKEDGLTWEQLGIDALFLDESQQFKNLHYITKQRGIAGMPNSHSQRAQDTYMKVRWMIDKNYRVVFSTGTPVSNSPAELFTQMRYLMGNRLERIGLDSFDHWSTTFGETVTAPEITPSGKYKMKTRFARFCNLPELTKIFREVADILTEDDLDLARPKVNLVTTINHPSPAQQQYMKALSARADAVQQKRVEPEQDNMLKITGDGRKCSLDPRMIGIPENRPDSKISELVWNLWMIWQTTQSMKAAQIVFCDLRAGVYEFIVQTLQRLGIPAHEHPDKKALYAKVNQGKIRVLIGSTETLGTGVNVQERLIAAHHLDAPWRPSDIVQREGRINRQGNLFKEVWIFRYVCQGSPDIASFDSLRQGRAGANAWQVLENKARFISQIWSREVPRNAEDNAPRARWREHSTVLTYAEVKALADGNPILMEQIKLEQEIKRLRLLRGGWERDYALEEWERKAAPNQIKKLEHKLGSLNHALNEPWTAEIHGIPVHGLKKIVEALRYVEPSWGTVGSIRGIRLTQDGNELELMSQRIKRSEQSLIDFFDAPRARWREHWLPMEIESTEGKIQKYRILSQQTGSRTFPEQEKMNQISNRLREITEILKPNLDGDTEPESADDDDEDSCAKAPLARIDTDLETMDWGSQSDAVIQALQTRTDLPVRASAPLAQWLEQIGNQIPKVELKTQPQSPPPPPTEHRFVPIKGGVLQGCLF